MNPRAMPVGVLDSQQGHPCHENVISPTKAHSAPTSPNIECLDLTWDEETKRSVKRTKFDEGQKEPRREELVREGKLAILVRNVVRQLDAQARNLSKCTSAHSNTKKEVKEMALKIRSLSSQLMTAKVQQLLQTLGKNPPGLLTQKEKDGGQNQSREADGTEKAVAVAERGATQEDVSDTSLIAKAKDKVGALRELLRERSEEIPDLNRKTEEILDLFNKAERQKEVDNEYKVA